MIAIVSFWRVTVVDGAGAWWLLAVDQHNRRALKVDEAFMRECDAWDLIDNYVGNWSPVESEGWLAIPPGDPTEPVDEFVLSLAE